MTKNARPKRDFAKKMMNRWEKQNNKSPFDSDAWENRKKYRRLRELNKQKKYERTIF